MKKILLFALMLVALASCKNETAFTITGDASGIPDGTVVRLLQRIKPDWILIDSTVVKNGAFAMKGQVDPGFLAYIEIDGADRFMIILEPGEIAVDVASQIAKGTPSNDILSAFAAETASYDSTEMAIFEKLDGADSISESEKLVYMHQLDSIGALYTDCVKRYMTENITNPCGIGMFTTYFSIFAEDVQMLLDLSEKIPECYLEQQPVALTIARINNIARTSVGSQYLDFEFNTIDGKQTSLKECVEKNRYVLIDFWASWCAPCRASLPGIKSLNDQFGTKGLCIIGVSLDQEQDAWVNAIRNFQMTWLQTSSLHYWDDEIAAMYGVSAIPATVLIDGNGTIVDRNVDIDALSEKLSTELTDK